MTLHVKDLMQKMLVSFPPSMGLDALEQGLTKEGISGAPVVNQGKVVGVVSRSDIVKQLGLAQTYAVLAYDFYDAPICGSNESINMEEIGSAVGQRVEQLKVENIMHHAIISISPNQTVKEAATLMLEKKIHRLLVIDEGQLCGVLSSSDFVALYANQGA